MTVTSRPLAIGEEKLPRFSMRQLDACVAAGELRNFSLVAKRLHLSPSAVSGLLSELEETLGFAVFERTTRKVLLTSSGRKFLPVAIALQQQFGRAQTAALDIRRQVTDLVRIAAPMVLAAAVMPPLLARYRLSAPRVTVRVVDTGVEWLADRVRMGDADLAIGPRREAQADITALPLFDSDWIMWFAKGDLMLSDEISWKSLANRRLFAAGRDYLNSIALSASPGQAPEVEIVDNMTTALGMTAAGLGITFSPVYVRPFAETFGVVHRPMPDGAVPRSIALFKPADRTSSASARDLEAFLIEELVSRHAPQ